jgi:hypothetical protein
MGLEHNDCSLAGAAALEWEGLFKHSNLGRDTRHNSEYHLPLDMVRRRLMLVGADCDRLSLGSNTGLGQGSNCE